MIRTFYLVHEDPPVPPPTPPPVPPSPELKFTQADLDRAAAAAKRESQKKFETQANQLVELQKNAQLTQQQRDDLQKQIEDLQTQYMTKEQLAAQAAAAEKKRHDDALKSTTTERDMWKTNFERTLITNAIMSGAAATNAYRAEQMVGLLAGKAKIVEVRDSEGKPTGQYEVLLRHDDVDPTTKQPVVLELPVVDAMKKMKEQPDVFGNLFKDTKIGGAGGSGGKAAKPIDLKNMTMDQYAAQRKGLLGS